MRRSRKASRRSVDELSSLLEASIAGDDEFRRAWNTVDRSAAVELARDHGVDLVLHDALERSPEPPNPADSEVSIRQCLAERKTFEAIAHGRLKSVLDEVLRAIEAARLTAVALKGPVLGERYYPPRAIRPSTDLDLLFDTGEARAAVEALRGIGYCPHGQVEHELSRPHVHHLELVRAGSPVVELHFRLHSEFGADVRPAPFIARSVAHRTAGGAPVRVLCPEDEVLYLALHAAAHRLIRIGWLYDIALIIARHRDLDWARVEERARATGSFSAVGFALGAVRGGLGAAIPEPMILREGARRARIARALCSSWATREGPVPVQRATSFVFATILCDDPAQSARSMKHLFVRFGARQARAIFGGRDG